MRGFLYIAVIYMVLGKLILCLLSVSVRLVALKPCRKGSRLMGTLGKRLSRDLTVMEPNSGLLSGDLRTPLRDDHQYAVPMFSARKWRGGVEVGAFGER